MAEQSPKVVLRSVPESLSAEAAVLGSMMVDHRCIGDVIARLDRDSFYHHEHQTIFGAIRALYERNRGEGVDGALVRDELERTHQLEVIGGFEYLQRVISTVPSSANIEYYTDIVVNTAVRRHCIQELTDLLTSAYDGTEEDPKDLLDKADMALSRIRRQLDGDSGQKLDLLGILQEEIERIGDRMEGRPDGTIPTGLLAVDAKLDGGLHPGELVIIAGRPGMGKTSLADTIIESTTLGDDPIPAAFFSLEMGQSQISRRLLCLRSNVPVGRMRRGRVLPEEYKQFLGIATDMGSKPLHVRDSGMFRSGVALRSEAYRLHREHGIKLVIIDYLGLMFWPGRVERKDIEIGCITGSLKQLAKDIGVPVVLLCQLSRKNESRPDPRPKLSDLRDSGNIEQDADVVMMLHREDYYHRDDPDYRRTGVAEVNIAKQRDGECGRVTLKFEEATMRFKDVPFESATIGDQQHD